jgi:hypothetical protein
LPNKQTSIAEANDNLAYDMGSEIEDVTQPGSPDQRHTNISVNQDLNHQTRAALSRPSDV